MFRLQPGRAERSSVAGTGSLVGPHDDALDELDLVVKYLDHHLRTTRRTAASTPADACTGASSPTSHTNDTLPSS
jgi:hypothetical protein